MVQTGIQAENDDGVTIVEVRTAKGARDGGSVVTPISIGVPRVKEENDDVFEVGNVCGDGVYVESAKREECNKKGGSNTLALRKMHGVEEAVTQYDVVQVTTQLKTDVIQEEARKVFEKEGDVQKNAAKEHGVDGRREVSWKT